MKLEKFAPSRLLQPYVNDFTIIESESEITNKILPGTSLIMAFRYKGTTFSDNLYNDSFPAFCLTGIAKTSRIITYDCNTAVLLVRFTEGGAAAFLNDPLHQMAGYSIPLDLLFDPWNVRKMEDRLGYAITNQERIETIEEFLLFNLKFRPADLMVSEAVTLIKSAGGNIKMSELVFLLNTNVNSLEKKFRSLVGISPKHFSSIIRINTAIKKYSPGKDLTKLSYEAGFFDQSHFIKCFKSFTGENPTHFFAKLRYW